MDGPRDDVASMLTYRGRAGTWGMLTAALADFREIHKKLWSASFDGVANGLYIVAVWLKGHGQI